MNAPRLPIVVLVSGRGSNLQSIIDAAHDRLAVSIRAVVSNVPDAFGLERARRAGIATRVLDHRAHARREAFDRALVRIVDEYQPALVALAGFMRILTPTFVNPYRGRLLNIHPSLLPAFPGLNTHRRALDARVAEHGASVHFVTEALDGGPLVIQARVPVHRDDTADRLAARVLEQEHRIYPQAISWFAEGRLELRGDTALLDGKPAIEVGRLTDY